MSQFSFAQTEIQKKEKSRKGQFYGYWGWNWEWYTRSNIHFIGDDHDFVLEDVRAKDRQTPFSSEIYLDPQWMTIPQYNFRVGYYMNDLYNISFGIDHMKYVMKDIQTVKINGEINDEQSVYAGDYNHEDINITPEFLKFEHTDGLNYANIELRRLDEFYKFGKIKFNFMTGVGIGILYPRSNITLMNKISYDEFHLAGYGVGVVTGLNFEFLNSIFLQSEVKAGFINMPDIRSTPSSSDKASQHFFFTQINVVLGFNINFLCREK